MSEELNKECPYCHQVNLTGEDARLYCGCYGARKYRKITAALDAVSTDAEPLREIDAGIMAGLYAFAHMISLGKATGITVNLMDGSKVTIGTKVSRSKRIKVEEKVDE